jgi:hypothetical protein
MEQMPQAEADTHLEEYAEFIKSIRESGHFVACNRLLPASTATTVRVRQGKVSRTDGPYVETKEQLGGYVVIEARNMDEAIEIAARIPGGRIGCVEVRQIAEDEQTLRSIGTNAPESAPTGGSLRA